jgi:hypothetical protein
MLEQLTQVQQRDWKEMDAKADAKIADIAAGRSTGGLRPKGAAKAAEKMARKASPSAPRARR